MVTGGRAYTHTREFTLISENVQKEVIRPQSIIEVFDAAQLTVHLAAPDFPKRGGIMVIGPPGALKTSFILAGFSWYPSALVLSDLNINSLMECREELISGRFTTLVFPEFEKLYQRRSDTASNIEGSIKQLVEDGFTRASFESQGMISMNARSLVVGAITYSFYSQHYQAWKNSGFARRFLWASIRLSKPHRIMQAVHDWKLLEIDGIPRRPVGQAAIPFNVKESESRKLWDMLRTQSEATPFVLLKKIFAVLKWKYEKQPGRAMEIMEEFSLCLTGNGIIEV
jgi:hypothetical protein